MQKQWDFFFQSPIQFGVFPDFFKPKFV